ncbi:DUF924 family protein [Algimonas porphyrae]|uniref:Membrane protein n=1 Tax=Algimonas porphyrae TaxID=1128113 RepID=A0ABQ5V2Y6_9PROT|nr:DUF924 family protein [Algimonas porphyrae]GLQ21896.1 membrane protein [Algimonas porphyrae]
MRLESKRVGKTAVTPQDVLDFWFAPDNQTYWFNATKAFDDEIRRRFERTASILADPVAVTGLNWRADPESQLAEIITLDQFPRNMYRDSPAAFAWDPLALTSADDMVDRGWDLEIPIARRSFVYMPLMHAENLIAQNRCVELSGTRLDDGGSTLRHAIAHRDVIERFGRFPHRNDVLGRDSTAEEREFLANGGYDPS